MTLDWSRWTRFMYITNVISIIFLFDSEDSFVDAISSLDNIRERGASESSMETDVFISNGRGATGPTTVPPAPDWRAVIPQVLVICF